MNECFLSGNNKHTARPNVTFGVVPDKEHWS